MEALQNVLKYAADGVLQIATEGVPLADIEAAWGRDPTGKRIVVIPYSAGLRYLRHPLCRICITSPSFTMYSLPSRRSVPRERASASEPASSSWSQWMVSARMK